VLLLAGLRPVNEVADRLGVGGEVSDDVLPGSTREQGRSVQVRVRHRSDAQRCARADPGKHRREGPHQPETTRFSSRPRPSISVTTVSPPCRKI
jgi:hypothetical protein